MTKYDIGGSQGRYQPGPNDSVLENKLGITEPADRDEAELVLLEKLYEAVLLDALPDGKITVSQIKIWHHRWLGNLYDWAGDERSVNMRKGEFQFAAAGQIPQLLSKFEQQYLGRYSPCTDFSAEQLTEAIAVVHVEFILIHPFRDGNGRISRLLADVMALQAGFPPLDYSSWDENKTAYFAAIGQGVEMKYEPMKQWVGRALVES
ncbi:MAG TPA: cell filamentation protein Fic [Acidiferrobacteraceae bacterium]|nr:cell filamentation protein Fic [Acidiferrobacteraceae bacterium]